MIGWKRNTYWLLVGNHDGRRSLGRPRHMWMDDIRRNLREIGLGAMDLIDVVQSKGLVRGLL
jgi:hypothetical protein